jgi:hypothetical protein
MNFLKCFVASGLVAVALLLVAPDIARTDDFMTLRYADGFTQKIRLERPSESIRQIEFSEDQRGGPRRGSEMVRSPIKVISGTYGRNCGAPYGNVTRDLAEVCDGRAVCDYTIDASILGDPAGGCYKDYFAEWQCGNNPQRGTISVPAEGNGRRIELRCPLR